MTTTTADYTGEERSKRIFAIVGASSGNLVEWFDFYVYAFCAIYFAPAFFPSDNPTVQLVNTAGVFAAGFLMRPIGGWIFGRVADKHGRKNSMLISQESYSIKKLEKYYSYGRSSDVKEAMGSMEYYDQYLELLTDDHEEALKLKRQVIAYNRDDCASTLALYKWLRNLT